MPSSNRVRVTTVQETTLGVTPNTPRMREKIVTGEQLSYTPQFETPSEIRSDRMVSDPVLNGVVSGGSYSFQLQYIVPNSPEDIDIQSAFYNSWVNAPARDNDGVADSAITNVAATGGIFTISGTGGAFAAGHLARATGFGIAGNNGIFKITTGSSTVPAIGNGILTDETVPPGTARLKVVGFYGAAGDITATASGLGSTTLNFTTLGLNAGQWLKVGGTAAADRFATAACNGWARITAIAANAITLDNLPVGWATDAGAAKTIKVWFGDAIKNGTTQISQSIERGHMGQVTPTYILQAGLVVSQYALTISAKKIITGQVTLVGMNGTQSQTSVDTIPDPAPSNVSYPLFSGSANVARVGEGGAALSSPNWVSEFTVTINNNATPIDAIDSNSPVDVVGHECTVTARLNTYFGDNTLLAKFFAGTPTALAAVTTKGVQAMVIALPRLTYIGGGSPNASGKNQVMQLGLDAGASKDTVLTQAQITLDRFEYYEV